MDVGDPDRAAVPERADANVPPMGARFRMKYGMLVADNGSNWYLSGAHDPRWDDDALGDLKQIPGSAFEAVDTGPVLR